MQADRDANILPGESSSSAQDWDKKRQTGLGWKFTETNGAAYLGIDWNAEHGKQVDIGVGNYNVASQQGSSSIGSNSAGTNTSSKVDGRDPLEDDKGNAAALSGQPYKKYADNSGWWVSAQQQLTTVDGNNLRGLNVFTNLTFNDPESSRVKSLVQVGLIYRGPFASRPNDTVGLGASRLMLNDRVSRNAELVNAENGVTGVNDALYVPVQKREYSYEINYGYQAAKWLMVRPNLQYVKYPGGLTQTDSAVVGGLQLIADF
ncbi:carbohydrate porin [Pseudomonas denitrificans (nom. rej.)]|nr:carbohydrate porin [Pseudomonas denitrificans (nom. rej.)]